MPQRFERARQRYRFIENALAKTSGAKHTLIARLARTNPNHVNKIWRGMSQQRIRFPIIDAPDYILLQTMGIKKGAGEHIKNIGRAGEEFVSALFPRARHVNKQGIDLELETRQGQITMEVKTIPEKSGNAVLKIPTRKMQWTNTNCDKLLILTRDNLVFLDRADINAFVRDYYLHHPKIMQRNKSILVLVKPAELVALGYATSVPIIGIARKRKELAQKLVRIRALYNKMKQA